MSAAKGLRWGVLGAARISPNAIVDPARSVGNRIVAVAARDRDRAEAFASKHGVERVYDRYESVIEADDVDAIYNPLPHGLHGAWNSRALAAGKHVLGEKPFAANAREAAEVAALARKSGLVVMEAFHYAYHPVAARIRELAASSELGELLRVEATFTIPPPSADDLRWSLPLAGGATMDLGCYCLHALRSLGPAAGGEPRVVSARARMRAGLDGIDEQMDAHLTFPSGVDGIVHCNMAGTEREASLRLIGSRGEALATEFVEPHLDDRVLVRTDRAQRVERLGTRTTYHFQLDAFLAAVGSGAPFATDVDDAVATMHAIDQCYLAAGWQQRQPTPVS